MPFPGESAGKTGHIEILLNPEVQVFLKECQNVPAPEAMDFTKLSGGFSAYPEFAELPQLPRLVLAIDGSTYEAAVDQRAPSRRIGYLKISSVLLDFDLYSQTRQKAERFIDPIELNRLKEAVAAISFALPGSYMQIKKEESVCDGFRRRIYECYSSKQTQLTGGLPLLSTLYSLCRLAGRLYKEGEQEVIKIHRCPGEKKDGQPCDAINIIVPIVDGSAQCPNCGAQAYATDCLRIHEAFISTGPNTEALNRLMSVTEHILIAHYLTTYAEIAPDVLSQLCIIVDGPLAVFGEAAWIHRAILLTILSVNSYLRGRGLESVLVMGFQKTGRLREHLDSIAHLMPDKGCYLSIADDYRYNFIEPGKSGSIKNFGDETYYGQDFFVKTSSDKTFVMMLPYEAEKSAKDFRKIKSDPSNYPDLPRALLTLNALESALYGGSVVPIMLAHANASISVVPGGRVLDLVSKKAVQGTLSA